MPAVFELAQQQAPSEDVFSKVLTVVGIAFLCEIPALVLFAYLLTTRGQTPGKIALGIKIVNKDTHENGGFVPNVLKRAILNGFIGFIPFYALVDILFIFGEEKRCLHDMIAGTIVVRADN